MNKTHFKIIFGIALIFSLFPNCTRTRTITLQSLLREMTDRNELTYLPGQPYQLKQASSYNRKTVEPGNRDWFANADMSYFVRVDSFENRREFVLFDQDGPGAIVRWWMTFWRAQYGTLRIYLDNDSIPELEGAPFKLISGQMLVPAPFSESVPEGAPMEERGHNLYLPIPFAQHCKVTYECDSLRLQDGHYFPDVFYNIGYRQYPEGTRVQTFSKAVLEAAKPELEKAGQLLMSDFAADRTGETFDREVQPGDSLVFILTDPRSALSLLTLKINSVHPEQALRSTVLAIGFDNHPTVWAPVGDFFGTGYQMYPHKTWFNQTTVDGEMKAAWVMPYRKQCRVAYINYGNDPVKLTGTIGLSDYQWKPTSLYFGATWHEYHHIKTRDTTGWFFDVNFANINGKGRYVGDEVVLFNMADTWWGEGDEKIFVDGEKFPSSIGTGSEDYYGYAFGRPESFSHPFISEPTGEGNFVPGMTVNMRHRSLDAIPFNTSISSNIELWHWASTCINYAMTAYFYVQETYQVNIRPDIGSVQLPVALTKEDFYAGSDTTCYSIEELRNK
jgi:hypothetical protein